LTSCALPASTSSSAGVYFTLTTDLGDLDILGEVTGVGGYAQSPRALPSSSLAISPSK